MPTRAKIVTRTETTSSNSTDNLNKGGKLTFAEMDSNFIELQNQSIGIADDGSTVIDISAGNTLTVAGAGGIQTSVSGQTLTIDGSNLGTIGDLTVTGSTISAPSNADLTLTNSGTGNINADSNRIINLGTPSAGTDAATKDYVDSATSAVTTAVVDDTTPQLGGNLDVNGQSIVSVSAGNISITPDTTGKIILDGLSWPTADGTTGQALITDGAGNLSFTTISGGGGADLGNLQVNDTTLSPVTTNSSIYIDAHGTGRIILGGADSSTEYRLAYDPTNRTLSFEQPGAGSNAAHYIQRGTTKMYIRDKQYGDSGFEFVSGLANGDGGITITPVEGQSTGIASIRGPLDGQLYLRMGGYVPWEAASSYAGGGTKIRSTYNGTTADHGPGIELIPYGDSKVKIDNNYWPSTDGTLGQVLQTNGGGVLSWANSSGSPTTFVGDDSTGTAVTPGETFKIAGGTGITTAVSGDTLTITGTAQDFAFSSLTGTPTTLAGYGITDAFDGAYGSLTGTPSIPSALTDLGISDGTNGQVLTTNGSGGFTFTTVSGSLPSQTGNSGKYLTTDGTTASWATVSGGSASTGDFVFTNSTMQTQNTNANMFIDTQGTGSITLGSTNRVQDLIPAGTGFVVGGTAAQDRGVVSIYEESVNLDSLNATADRRYANMRLANFTLTGSGSGNSNERLRQYQTLNIDAAGYNMPGSNLGNAINFANTIGTNITNSSATAMTAIGTTGIVAYTEVGQGNSNTGDITVTHSPSVSSYLQITANTGTTSTVTNGYGFVSGTAGTGGSGTRTLNNYYGFYVRNGFNDGNFSSAPNRWGFYAEDNTFQAKLGAIKHFTERAYEATHSSGAGYTIDLNNGNLQIVTLSSNITSFTMSNFLTNSNNSGGVTLYLVQDGTGGRGITYSAGASETFKFANGTNTSSNTAAGDITVVYIFSRYDGTNMTYYWTIGPAYS